MAASSSSRHLCNIASFLSSPSPPTTAKTQKPTSLFPHPRHHYPSLSSNPTGSIITCTNNKPWRLPSSSSPSTLEWAVEDQRSDEMDVGVLETPFPSLVFANVLWFKAGYNVQVVAREDEPEEVLLRRFRREVMKAGVIQECKRRRFFEDKQAKSKRKTREAAKKNRNFKRRRPRPKIPPPDDKEASKGKKDEAEEEDNWELPDVELPYC